jgi:hypothetical protein
MTDVEIPEAHFPRVLAGHIHIFTYTYTYTCTCKYAHIKTYKILDCVAYLTTLSVARIV